MKDKILQLSCKKHVKIFKLSQLNIPNKEIAQLTGSNTGHVWNVINDYKKDPKKVEAANKVQVVED